jgi:hypothetical protein
MPASTGRQSVWSGVHIPEGQGVWVLMLQLPFPSQVGVTRVSTGQEAVPQTVPGGWGPFATHLALPDMQEIMPISHALGRVQAPPAVQETQLPELQTMLFPQVVPSLTLLPVSWQADVPVWQLSIPV